MAQDAGQAEAPWTEDDWLAALNILIDDTLPRAARMATHAQVLAQVAALTAERDTLRRAVHLALAGRDVLTAQVERLRERARDGCDAASAAYQTGGTSRGYVEAMQALGAIVRQAATTPAPAAAPEKGER